MRAMNYAPVKCPKCGCKTLDEEGVCQNDKCDWNVSNEWDDGEEPRNPWAAFDTREEMYGDR